MFLLGLGSLACAYYIFRFHGFDMYGSYFFGKTLVLGLLGIFAVLASLIRRK
jgi:hypothetical protein